jgi:hypothetical protein
MIQYDDKKCERHKNIRIKNRILESKEHKNQKQNFNNCIIVFLLNFVIFYTLISRNQMPLIFI